MTTTPEADELETQIQSPRDSAFSSPGWPSSTCSVHSENLGYTELHDRWYGRGFPFPIDDAAQDDHDFRNAIFEKVLQKKIYAPVNLNGANVLELYTRTGIFAVTIGDGDASCLVTGVDESKMQTEHVPPNVNFEICDLENDNDWTWRQRFRLIIIRGLGVFVKDLPALVRRCHMFLEAGGWIEIQILTLLPHSQLPSMNEGSKIRELHHHLSAGLAALGRQLDIQDDLTRILEENNFRHLDHLLWRVPLGTWPKDKNLKEIGRYWEELFYQQLEALTLLPFMEGLKWNRENYQIFLLQVRSEMKRLWEFRMVTELHVFYAQKASS